MAIKLPSVIGLSDPMTTDNFEVIIPNLPSGLVGVSPDFVGEFSVKNVDMSLPSQENEVLKTTIHRHDVRWSGRKSYEGVVKGSFIETANSSVIEVLYAWSNFCTPVQSGNPNPKSTYVAKEIDIYLLSASNEKVAYFKLYNAWVSKLSPAGLTSEGGKLLQWEIEFTYDLHEYIRTPTNPADIQIVEDNGVNFPTS